MYAPLRYLWCVALSVLVFSTVSAQTIAPAKNLNTGVNDAHSPELHVARNGDVFVTWFSRSADIYMARLRSGSASFDAPVRVSQQVTMNSYTSMLQRAPEFAIDTKGTIHMVWTEDRIKQQSDVWYVRSTDHGATWTMPMSIMDVDDSMKYAQDFPAIAIDSSDNLYVSYLDNRDLVRGAGTHYRLRLQRSFDGGKTWMAPVVADKLPIANSGTCECCRQDIAVSPEGEVYVAFRTNMYISDNDNKRDIFIARSHDRGATFDSSIRTQLQTWTILGCPTTGPHIALDARNNLHLSWRDDRDAGTNSTSYYALLRNGDNSVVANVALGAPSNWPDVTVNALGSLASVHMSDNNKLTFRSSSDGGNNWSQPKLYPSNSAPQSLPILRWSPDGALYSVWQEGSSPGSIYFTSITSVPAPQPLRQSGLRTVNVPEIGKPVTIAWSKPEGFARAPFVWYTLSIRSSTFSMDSTLRDTTMQVVLTKADTYTYSVTTRTVLDSTTTTKSFTLTAASVGEGIENSSLRLEANPVSTHGSLTIALPSAWEGAQEVQFVCYDAAGRLVQLVPSSHHGLRFEQPLAGLAPGIYHGILTSGPRWATCSFVVE